MLPAGTKVNFSQQDIYYVKIEILRIKTTPNPIKKLFVLFVVFIAYCIEKSLITPWSTAIFRGTVSLAFKTKRFPEISLVIFNNVFDSNLMLPPVSQVIPVCDRIANTRS